MIRPLTCLSLVAALGAGLYLYQEKHRALMLDRDITHTVKLAEVARDRIGLLKAEWALLNEPDRLATLATQHLQLQALQPTQFVRVEDFRGHLPPISLAPSPPAAMDEPPVAALAPSVPLPVQVAMIQSPVPASASTPAVANLVQAARPLPSPAVAAAPPIQLAAAHPLSRPTPHALPSPKVREADSHAADTHLPDPRPSETVARAAEPERHHPLFAPVMPAYAPTPVVIHAPTVQTASAMAPTSALIGSALGMARSVLAAPVPVASAATLGYAAGR